MVMIFYIDIETIEQSCITSCLFMHDFYFFISDCLKNYVRPIPKNPET